MLTIPCYGVHPDEVGLRYLVQGKEVHNALGFSQNPKFTVRGPKYKYACPHSHELQDFGTPDDDELIKFLSPIPSKEKGRVYEGDPTKLTQLAEFSGADCIAAWMLNAYMTERITLASNIHLTIIMGAAPRNSEMLDDLQAAMEVSQGKVIFQGDYYFSNKFKRIGEPKRVENPTKTGISNLFDYLKERN